MPTCQQRPEKPPEPQPRAHRASPTLEVGAAGATSCVPYMPWQVPEPGYTSWVLCTEEPEGSSPRSQVAGTTALSTEEPDGRELPPVTGDRHINTAPHHHRC